MKVITLITILLSFNLSAQEQCDQKCREIKQDVNTPTPEELKDAEIIIKTKDGKERKVSANEFKVVKRKQQFKVVERVVTIKKDEVTQAPETKIEYVKASETKNIVMLGLRKDHESYSTEINGNSTTVFSNKELIVDLSYYRRKLFDTSFGAGVGLDTNKTPRAFVGFEF